MVAVKNTSGVSYDIGLIVGLVFAGLALLAIILYLYFSRKTLPAGKEDKVVPGLENFLDLETAKAADTTKKRPPTSQPKGFNTNFSEELPRFLRRMRSGQMKCWTI